jgi:hypothetical protein
LKKEWYKITGTMQLLKSDKLIREYKFHTAHDRRRMLKIWQSEVKPNGVDYYELIIKLD